MNQKSELDPEALVRLQRIGKGAKFVRDMIDLFFSYAPAKLSEARVALQTGDLRAVSLAAHSLKSGAGNLGAHLVEDLAGRVEETASGNHDHSLPALLEELQIALDRALAQLEAARDRLEP